MRTARLCVLVAVARVVRVVFWLLVFWSSGFWFLVSVFDQSQSTDLSSRTATLLRSPAPPRFSGHPPHSTQPNPARSADVATPADVRAASKGHRVPAGPPMRGFCVASGAAAVVDAGVACWRDTPPITVVILAATTVVAFVSSIISCGCTSMGQQQQRSDSEAGRQRAGHQRPAGDAAVRHAHPGAERCPANGSQPAVSAHHSRQWRVLWLPVHLQGEWVRPRCGAVVVRDGARVWLSNCTALPGCRQERVARVGCDTVGFEDSGQRVS